MTRLEQLRKERGLSYNRVAAFTGNVMTYEGVRRVALGRGRPRPENAKVLAQFFGEPIDALLAQVPDSQ